MLGAVFFASAPAAQAKTPGKTYCFNGTCHAVKSLPQMASLVGREEVLTASFYDDCKRDRYNPCGLTSSGEKFRPNDADNAASPVYPDGTVLLLRNPVNGEAVTVRVNNAGPYWGKTRKLDVSRATAQRLGFKARGVARLEVKIISAPTAAEARYKKNRRYEAVPGPLGAFTSLAAAHAGHVVAMVKSAPALQMASLTAGDTPTNRSISKSARDKLKIDHLQVSGIKLAAAAELIGPADVSGIEGSTPADGLRAAARRALGVDRDERRLAPSTLTAQAIYAHMRQSIN